MRAGVCSAGSCQGLRGEGAFEFARCLPDVAGAQPRLGQMRAVLQAPPSLMFSQASVTRLKAVWLALGDMADPPPAT